MLQMRKGTQEPACPQYLLHILDTAISQRDARYPHSTSVAIGAFPIELGPGRLIDVAALGAQELLEDSDYSGPITSVRVFLVLLGKPSVGERNQNWGFQDSSQGCERSPG